MTRSAQTAGQLISRTSSLMPMYKQRFIKTGLREMPGASPLATRRPPSGGKARGSPENYFPLVFYCNFDVRILHRFRDKATHVAGTSRGFTYTSPVFNVPAAARGVVRMPIACRPWGPEYNGAHSRIHLQIFSWTN